MKASQVWYWTGSHYKVAIMIGEYLVDNDTGEIWFKDEVESVASADGQEPFMALADEWKPMGFESVVG